MIDCYDSNYVWYEVEATMKDYLDEETNGSIVEIVDVFQHVDWHGTSGSSVVVTFTHTLDTTIVNVQEGFWIEDDEMGTINVSFDDAFNSIMEVNLPKPHSKKCVLRNQVAPIDCGAVYIFGNIQEQIYVNAVTGRITKKNPAFEGVLYEQVETFKKPQTLKK